MTFETSFVLDAYIAVFYCTNLSFVSCRVELLSNATVLSLVSRNETVSTKSPIFSPVIFDNPLGFCVSNKKYRMVNNSMLWFASQCS